jgi:hypothetical protein
VHRQHMQNARRRVPSCWHVTAGACCTAECSWDTTKSCCNTTASDTSLREAHVVSVSTYFTVLYFLYIFLTAISSHRLTTSCSDLLKYVLLQRCWWPGAGSVTASHF